MTPMLVATIVVTGITDSHSPWQVALRMSRL